MVFPQPNIVCASVVYIEGNLVTIS